MKRSCSPVFCLLALLSLCLGSKVRAADQPPAGLAGTWRIDLNRGTELSPWKSYDLIIAVNGSNVSVTRKLAWGRREFVDQFAIDTAKADNAVPIDYWPDNRHIGAYIGRDHTRHIRSQWIDDRRIVRLSTDLVLETQQGPRAVNILSDYKVSASGNQLTLTELRSTRNRPIVYVFNRIQ